ncbi:MAG: hypothetical protein MUC60_16630 [Oscillatoria sp. Prado101]|nr:hypothetical protein [Oscillatoria sp. Prado101]
MAVWPCPQRRVPVANPKQHRSVTGMAMAQSGRLEPGLFALCGPKLYFRFLSLYSYTII